MKVLLGLSGGVDSQVAARLLQEQGHEVIGLYLDNGFPGADRAARAAAELGIPFYTRDIREALETHVCAPFAAGYLRGETTYDEAVDGRMRRYYHITPAGEIKLAQYRMEWAEYRKNIEHVLFE